MKKITVLLIAVLATAFAFGDENLLKNGDFNGSDFFTDISCQMSNGKIKAELFTEDYTWNKCARMEVLEHRDVSGRKMLSASLQFGKDKGLRGFPVKPGAEYDFSFDIKGELPVSLWVYLSDKPFGPQEKGRGIRPVPLTANGEKDSWTRVKGSFKTDENAKFALFSIMLWADSKQQRSIPAVGSYVLIDNVTISPRKNLLEAGSAGEKGRAPLRPVMTVPYKGRVLFNDIRGKLPPLQIPVEISGSPENINVSVTLPPAGADLKPISQNGANLWREDVFDLFFEPVTQDRAYSQFAISSGGGRYIGNGRKLDDFASWSGKVTQLKAGRKMSITVPWRLLGYASMPAAGTALGFNIGLIYDHATYSYAPVKLGFSDLPNFGRIIFGTIGDFQKKAASQLEKEGLDSFHAEIKAFSAKNTDDASKLYAAYENLCDKIADAKLGTAPFLAARLSTMGEYFAPLSISKEQLITDAIKLRGARNEKLFLPIAILNRTAKIASYRVVVHADAPNQYIPEMTGLDKGFPPENIVYREIVPVKDSNGNAPGAIYDALPRMNEAQVITVPPNDCGAIWLEFDCNKVPCDTYKGYVRIIPLMEMADFSKKDNVKSQIRDYPVEIQVLPITLPPPLQLDMFSQRINENYFKRLCDLGSPRMLISAYAFKFKYDDNGNITYDEAPLAKGLVKELKGYFKNAPSWVTPRFILGYSYYDTFKKINLPKTIKPLTPAWENCWRNHVKATMKVCKEYGIEEGTLWAELTDEPRGEFFDEYLAAAKIANEAAPDLKLTMTWGHVKFGMTPKLAAAFDPYITEEMYWWGLLSDEDFMRQREQFLKRPGTCSSIYECSTSLRVPLHNYYRLHPWKTRVHGFDRMGFYTFTNHLFGLHAGPDWRLALSGGIVYRAGDACIPSVRYYALMQGLTDIRYYDALNALPNRPDASRFLKEASRKVLSQSYDKTLPDWFKEQAINLLLNGR
ncbi:MAG: hypothetical protein IKS20_06655 [Victivallales bacterium]|nr:hypothetical protein [Victivallales bacterium]